jgi:hypothetical protein
MKGSAERQLKGLETTQKKKKEKLEVRKLDKVKTFPCHLLPHLHQPLVLDVERHSRMTGSSAEAVCNGGVWIVPFRNEVAGSCVTAAKFDACALLHIHSEHTRPPRCPNVRILRTTVKNTYVSLQFLCLTFITNRLIKFGMYLHSFITQHKLNQVEKL